MASKANPKKSEPAERRTRATAAPSADEAAARSSLAALRERIDQIDGDVLKLLGERYQVIQDVQRVKQRSGDGVYVPERERAQIARLTRLNEESAAPIRPEALRAIFREILSASRALQGSLTVSYLGPAGTYSERAAREQFGSSTTLVPAASIPDVFRAVERGEARYGIVPVENSTEGMVVPTLDSFVTSPLTIVAERDLLIRHAVLSRAASLKQVKKVVSHPQSLAQCRDWLRQNLTGVPTVAVASNAVAAQTAARTRTTAAIASTEAAETYGLRVLASNVQDLPHNVTRFVVIGQPGAAPAADADKVSLLFSVKNRAGMLFKSLKPLAERGIDLCKIESRPMRGRPWEYLFFLDFRGRLDDRRVADAMAEMTRQSVWVKTLGAYAAASAAKR